MDYLENQAVKTWNSKTSYIAPFSKSYQTCLQNVIAAAMRECGRTCNQALTSHDALRSATQPPLGTTISMGTTKSSEISVGTTRIYTATLRTL